MGPDIKTQARDQALRPFDAAVLAAATLLPLLFSLYQWAYARPGFAWTDESMVVVDIQRLLEGKAFEFAFGTGSLLRLAHWASAALLGARLSSLHLPVIIAFLFESTFLALLSFKLYGRRGMLFSVMANGFSAFTLLRLRSLLCYAWLPSVLLALLCLIAFFPRQRLVACAGGFLASLFLLDYEAWVVAGPLLVIAAVALTREDGFEWPAWIAGIVLGLGLVAWLSYDSLAAWWELRRHFSGEASSVGPFRQWLGNLRDHFFGAAVVLEYTGIYRWPVPALWGLPLAALGILSSWRRPWLLLALLMGLLPLAARSYGAEPQRGIVAWPMLCLAVGAGSSWLMSRWSWTVPLLWVLPFVGVSGEAWAYQRSVALNFKAAYGQSQALIEAAGWLRQEAALESLNLITELTSDHGACLRFLCRPARFADSQVAVDSVLWVPSGSRAAFADAEGSWIQFGQGSESFLRTHLRSAYPLLTAEAELREKLLILPSKNRKARAERLKAWLNDASVKNPWVRSELWTLYASQAALSGQWKRRDFERMLRERLMSVDCLYWPALYMARRDPELSYDMLMAAKKRFPKTQIEPGVLKVIFEAAKKP